MLGSAERGNSISFREHHGRSFGGTAGGGHHQHGGGRQQHQEQARTHQFGDPLVQKPTQLLIEEGVLRAKHKLSL